jgi:dihydroorotase (multifunctional complex type)
LWASKYRRLIALNVDLVIKNAKIVSPRGFQEGGVAVDDGVIVAISKEPNLPKADEVVDVKGRYLLPGILDGHAHTCLLPETPSSGTKAAIKGGVTTLLEMPGTQMGCFDPQEYEAKLRLFTEKSHIDFCIHSGCASGYPKGNLTSMWGMGSTGVKFFVSNAGPKWPQTFDGEILDRFSEISGFNGLALIHSENGQIIRDNQKRLQAEGRRDFGAYLESRPPISELECGRRMITYLKATGCRGMLVHTSLPDVVSDVWSSRGSGVKLSIETCPQYLYITDEDVKKRGPWAKFAPPARTSEAVHGIRRLLAEGYIDTVASDHAPYTKEMKQNGLEDIFRAPNGIPGLETLVSLLVNGVNEGWLSLERFAQVTSENPARLYGIYPKKGTISLGSDADFVIIDMDKNVKIRDDDQITACGWSPYDGMKVKGSPVQSFIRGNLVMEDDVVYVKEGFGKYVFRMD